MSKRVNQSTTPRERGRLDGIAWIQIKGSADCTDAEIRDQAEHNEWYPDVSDREAYLAGFLAGVESMTIPG